MITKFITVLAVSFFSFQICGQEILSPVAFNKVIPQDNFWLPRLQKQKTVLVPFALDKTKPAVENLRRTADFLKGKPGELPFTHRYVASDLYKVMEGAAYLLALDRDPELEPEIDRIIDIIAEAQQKDGYNYESHITGVSKNDVEGMGKSPYSFVVHSHELYNMGHMYEGAVAYYQATGKDKWLKVAEANARHINNVFFEGNPDYNGGKPVNQAPGHQEIELALVKLFRATGDSLYLNMAKKFLDIRGVTYRPEGTGTMSPEYAQQHLPVRAQTKAVGHAVRATYLYSGMADVSVYANDPTLRPALDHIWHNIVDTRMHITGGLGAIHGIEGFGPEYELPNQDAFDETCAAVGNVFFNHRMFLMEKDGKYMDVAEVALLNNVLAGVNLEGNRFFYLNPLEADGVKPFNHGLRGRSPWFGTACCPSNLARLIPQVPGLMYATTENEVYCSFYAGSRTVLDLKSGTVELNQTTHYPFGESVRWEVIPGENGQNFKMKFRIPTWTGAQFVPGKLYHYINAEPSGWSIVINGKEVSAPITKGFAEVDRSWKKGDVVELRIPMPLRYSKAIEAVKADSGRVCLTRGPLVYCAEGVDNGDLLPHVFIEGTPALVRDGNKVLDSVPAVTIPAWMKTAEGKRPVDLTLLPYYAWNNRGDGSMMVWFPETESVVLHPEKPIVSSKIRLLMKPQNENAVGDFEINQDKVREDGSCLNGNYLNNRAPLLAKPYIELPIGAIKPEGWLKEQLLRMAKGLTGNMDAVYERVMGVRNGWLGGDGDVWERGPYWIDGLLPLAYILNDQALIEKTKPWIEWTLASQKPNGYFGPDTDRPHEAGLQRDNAHDWWPKMVMLKVMQQYYSATGDQRVISFLTNYFKFQWKELPQSPLGKWTFWGEQRGGDNLLVVYWLYTITGDKFLLELGELIHKQTLDWTDIFLHQDHLKRQHSLHCVNLAQGFKEPVIYYQQNQEARQIRAVKKAVEDMRHTIAFPTGLWAGDELLRFGNPNLGSELCTAVEMMFSLEKMLEITGDVQWADHLERIAFNALPTQVTDDFSARQYYHQINQIAIDRNWRDFVTPHDDTDNLHGVLTGYPCCTSNMHQGWPKLVQNLWYATANNGIAALVYAPSAVTAKVADGVNVQIVEETAYPFEETIRFVFSFPDKKVKKAFFPFHLRIPSWCKQPLVRLNGEVLSADTCPGEIVCINREWKRGDKLTLELPMHIEASYWFDRAAVIERGPLVYALKMNEKWAKKEIEPAKVDQYGEWYYEVTSDTPWNYALTISQLRPNKIDEHFKVVKSSSVSVYPWTLNDAPITIKGKGRPIKTWSAYRGSAGSVPYFTQQGADSGQEMEIELIPFGCTTLRITEFPVRND